MSLTIFDPFGSFEVPEGASPLTIETRRNEFYQLIGKCIKEWANVEEKLFELFVFALKAPRQQAAVVYYRCPTIDARLKLTDELVRVILPQRKRKNGGHDHPFVITWTKLFNAITAMLPERNLLAHAPIREVETVRTQIPITGTDSIKTLASWLEIVESKGEQLRDREEKKPIRIKDLSVHLKEVESLSARIAVFHGTIAEELLAKPAPNNTPQSRG